MLDTRDAIFEFMRLSMKSRPMAVVVGRILAWFAFACLTICVICMDFYNIREYGRLPKFKTRSNQFLYSMARIAVIVGSVFLVFHLFFISGCIYDLDVSEKKRAGVYDIKVIRSDSSAEIMQWLSDNGFEYDTEDQEVFDQYVQNGWCFVAARVNDDMNAEADSNMSSSLTAPLCMRFETDQPIYPMALTARASEQTAVVLYLITDSKMDCGGRLDTDYYGLSYSPLSRQKLLYF